MNSQMQIQIEPEPRKSGHHSQPDCFGQSVGNRSPTTALGQSGRTVGPSRGLPLEIAMARSRRRLLVAVTNDPAGNRFLDTLRQREEELRFHFAGTLGEILQRRGIENANLADDLSDKFAFLDILPGEDFSVMNSVLRHGCVTKLPGAPFPDVDVEPAQRLQYARAGLGPNYDLRSAGSMHDQYLQMLNTRAATSNGSGAVIAVIDSGFEKAGVLSGFLDLVEPNNKNEKDILGHGTAMASIIKDIAPGATLYVVRMADQGPDVSDAMLGIAAGSFHYQADIINLSFGLPEGKTCSLCGAQAAGSSVFRRFLASLSGKAMAAMGPPVLVAATGNDGRTNGFDSPARWDFTLAVGSINKTQTRSSFSNYGTKFHDRYIMMPGGEEQQGAITEWIGEASYKCAGTSAAAAYASGVLALYMSDTWYQEPDRQAFLDNVLDKCTPCYGHDPDEHGKGYLAYLAHP
jgi:subtilisin family serine protease